jgi:monoamine oxidase
VLLDYGEQLRKPSGRIHWAGTETATIWNGYMDGAIRRVSARPGGARPAARVQAEAPRSR